MAGNGVDHEAVASGVFPEATVVKKARRKFGVVKGPDMTLFKAHEPGEKQGICRGTMAFVMRDKMAAGTVMSFVMTDYSFLGPQEYISRYFLVGNVLTMQRNECIRMMQGDWLIFLDSDMTWQPEAIKTLVETREKFDLDILGGLCFQRGDPYQPTLYKAIPEINGTGYTFMEDWPEDTAVEVDATGMAFVIIHKRVFDKILLKFTGEPFPSFEERERMPAPPFFRWDGELGEDFQFCKDAKEAGCRVFVDTGIKIGHIGEVVIDESMFLRELAVRSDEVQRVRTDQLGTVGLKPRSREDARRTLGWEK